jgi:hypothetical protein
MRGGLEYREPRALERANECIRTLGSRRSHVKGTQCAATCSRIELNDEHHRAQRLLAAVRTAAPKIPDRHA